MLQFETVLCPVDFTPLSKSSLALAIEVCRKLKARLVLEHNLSVAPPSSLGVSWMWEEEQESPAENRSAWATQRLQELFEQIPDDIPYEAKLTRGPLDHALEILVDQLPVDLIVMGTHGPTTEEHRSLTEKAICRVSCPVLTLGERYDPQSVMAALAGEAPEGMTVVIPYDFSRRARAALDFGLALGERMPHHLKLVHVVPESHGRRRDEKTSQAVATATEQLQSMVPKGFSRRMSVEVRVGDEPAGILSAADAAEAIFILMPAHAEGAIKRFVFGSTTRTVLHGSGCPVLFIPPTHRLPS
jgi:nucleotide-binding universal stress UspA family protein